MPHSGELLRCDTAAGIMVILGPQCVNTIGNREDQPSAVASFPLGTDVIISPPDGWALYDDVPYTLQVSAKAPIEVTQAHRPIDLQWVFHGSIYIATTRLYFRQIGWTELRIGSQGVRVAVHSRKMDYDADYREMIRDLENQVRGLTARLISHLVSPMDLSEDTIDLWSYWLALLEKIWEDLSADILMAWHTLPPQLQSSERVVNIERLRKPKARDLRTYARGRTRFSSQVRVWEAVTPERLYILQLIQDVHRRILRIEDGNPGILENRRLASIAQDSLRLLRQLSTDAGLERIVGVPNIPSSPLAESHPALRRVVRWHRLMRRGLFPEGQSYLVGPKDISLLYEYWCYLTIVRLVVEESRGHLLVEPTASVRPEDITLGAGKDACARVQLPNGEQIEVLYQRLYGGLPTVAQQPDHVVQIRGSGRIVVFDAKYRFELSEDSIRNYGKGMPIPPVSTINSMHRYRDAIVLPSAFFDRMVDRAIVLFPLPRIHFDDWVNHRFYRSINSVGVGVIPLVPGGSDKYLRGEIRRCLNGVTSQ